MGLSVKEELKGRAYAINGAKGNGIARIEKTNSVGLVDIYTIYYTEGNTDQFTIENGNGIHSIQLNDNYTLTIVYTDGTSYTTPSIRGEKGERGKGITSIRLNDNYTLTIVYTDGTSYTTPSIRGEKGEKGNTPVKGVDYFTYSEIQSFKNDIVSGANSDFNRNVLEKTNNFNNNVTAKTNSFNRDATQKTSEYNTNAANKAEAFTALAATKTDNFNQNATSKTNTFNNNASEKITEYNTNASSKISEYNANATEKIEEFNDNVSKITQDINDIKAEQTIQNTKIQANEDNIAQNTADIATLNGTSLIIDEYEEVDIDVEDDEETSS